MSNVNTTVFRDRPLGLFFPMEWACPTFKAIKTSWFLCELWCFIMKYVLHRASQMWALSLGSNYVIIYLHWEVPDRRRRPVPSKCRAPPWHQVSVASGGAWRTPHTGAVGTSWPPGRRCGAALAATSARSTHRGRSSTVQQKCEILADGSLVEGCGCGWANGGCRRNFGGQVCGVCNCEWRSRWLGWWARLCRNTPVWLQCCPWVRNTQINYVRLPAGMHINGNSKVDIYKLTSNEIRHKLRWTSRMSLKVIRRYCNLKIQISRIKYQRKKFIKYVNY